MPSLKRYQTFLLDANCIVYYCFDITEVSDSGQVIILRCMDITGKICFTDKSKKLFDFVKQDSSRKIITIQMVYDEIINALPKEFKKQRESQDLRNQLGLPRGERFPEDFELKLIEKMNDNLSEVKNADWFTVEVFMADEDTINNVEAFYKQLISDNSKQGLLKPLHPMPEREDINLIIFSKIKSFPLVSNDKHIHGPRIELKQNNLIYEAMPLMEITV